jgi:hypothetical protein
MVRVIIVGAMADYDIRAPFANEPANCSPILHCHHQLAVMDIEHFYLVSQNLSAFAHFSCAAQRKRSACHSPMAHISVRARNEFYVVALGGPLCRGPGRAELAVVRVSTENNDSQLAVRGRNAFATVWAWLRAASQPKAIEATPKKERRGNPERLNCELFIA